LPGQAFPEGFIGEDRKRPANGSRAGVKRSAGIAGPFPCGPGITVDAGIHVLVGATVVRAGDFARMRSRFGPSR
jgi:hypothetical protein